MVPKLHAKGRSFRGAAAYLLHDKGRAKTAHRVAWAETRNLATEDPETAWRIMAATAMDQERLKAQAGVKNTGRKSADSVLHLTLSWHPDEKAALTREEMLRAGHGALRALNAEDRQALFVCHDDEPQPHLHVLLNRVSPDDGRMLSSSKEKLALSQWAEAYEKERGQVLCEERVINNAARKRGEYVRGEPDKPRHIYELEATNDNRPDAGQVRDEQRRRDAEAAKRDREIKQRQAKAWRELVERHKNRVREIREGAKRELAEKIKTVRESYRPDWKELFHEQQASLRDFEQQEEKLIGRVKNAMKSIDFGAIIRSGGRRRAITEAFQVLSSSGARVEAVKRRHAEETQKLQARQAASERKAAEAVRRSKREALARNRTLFERERADVVMRNGMDGAAVRATWKTRTQQRREAWERRPAQTRGDARMPAPPTPARTEAAIKPERPSRVSVAPPTPPKPETTGTQSTTADDAKRQAIEAFREKMRQRSTEKDQDRDRDR